MRNKGTRRGLTGHNIRSLQKVIKTEANTSSIAIFQKAGVAQSSRTSRHRILKDLARHVKPTPRAPVNAAHTEKRINWVRKYMKTDYCKVIFTYQCRASLDGPDGWAKVGVPIGAPSPSRLWRQQGSGGVMFWAGIVGDQLIGPYRYQKVSRLCLTPVQISWRITLF